MSSATPELDEVAAVFRESHGVAVASLMRSFRDLSIAEDAVQDAFVVATERWPRDGIPPNPAGWIITTARRRAIDRVRRSTRGRELERQSEDEAPTLWSTEETDDPVVDDRLRLIFTCCHPALRPDHQVALTLRLLGGLDVDEVARAFLVSESAMARRLTRAKYKIKAAEIPYRVPAAADLPDRLHTVLTVLYLIYNQGSEAVADSGGALRSEAIRLARSVVALMPDEPEAVGLLALLLLNESRVPARVIGADTILLRDQDRSRWDSALIEEGQALVRSCIRRGSAGPFQLQAAIQAVHSDASHFDETDWPQIVTLYDHLYSLQPTAVVALNRAIAVGEAEGAAAELAALDALGTSLDEYAHFNAARGDALGRLGQRREARLAMERAVELTTSEADRSHLQRRIAELGDQ